MELLHTAWRSRGSLAGEELVGLDALRAFGDRVYGDLDAASRLHEGQPLRITRRAGRTTLSLELPFADRDDLELGRNGPELLVRVGAHRRAIVLPDSLRRRRVKGATMVAERLEVTFAPTNEEQQ
jgi:arsenite-transporting ATPase